MATITTTHNERLTSEEVSKEFLDESSSIVTEMRQTVNILKGLLAQKQPASERALRDGLRRLQRVEAKITTEYQKIKKEVRAPLVLDTAKVRENALATVRTINPNIQSLTHAVGFTIPEFGSFTLPYNKQNPPKRGASVGPSIKRTSPTIEELIGTKRDNSLDLSQTLKLKTSKSKKGEGQNLASHRNNPKSPGIITRAKSAAAGALSKLRHPPQSDDTTG